MWYWWVMLLCDMIVPVVMVVAGIIMLKHCPKKINMLLGYRTTRSMVNMDTWRFAHHHCGRLWWRIGLIMLILSALAHIPFYQSSEAVIGTFASVLCWVQVAILVVSVFPTERALKKTFNDDGTRK